MHKVGVPKAVSMTLIYLVLIATAVIVLAPFVWMFLATFKPEGSVLTYPPRWFPEVWDFSSYQRMLTSRSIPLLGFFRNSLLLATLVTVGQLLFSSLAAFAFARLNFPGRDKIFLAIIATMMVPFAVTFIPNFLIMTKIGWIGTYLPIVIPGITCGVFGIFLMRQYMKTLPMSLEESARIDGCSNIKIFFLIDIPLVKPALAALAVNTFMGSWNDYFGPLIYLNDMSKYTLPVGLQYFMGMYKTDTGLLMTGAAISIIPMVLLFMFAQNYFIEGIAMSGLKN